MAEKLVLATRGSRLALVQSKGVRDALCRRHPGLRVELLVLKTKGDKILDVALSEIGGKGLFTKEIEEAMLDGRADLAVHSLKDLPTDLPRGLALAALTEREDPRDALICREAAGLDDLPEGGLVGTSSLRRAAQLAHGRPDLRFQPVRGNVETRLGKLESEKLDAIVLAAAGLRRLGLADRITQLLPPEVSLPAAGQGIVAIEARAGDRRTLDLLAAIHSPVSRTCATAERAALAVLGGGCQTPIGLWAQSDGAECRIEGMVAGLQGEPYYRAAASGPAQEAQRVGERLAADLLAQGAAELV